jgi:hypothetical protein
MSTSNWPDVVTPKDIAERLRIRTTRPDKTLRAFLRSDPAIPHAPYERWEFTPQQADEIVRRWYERR